MLYQFPLYQILLYQFPFSCYIRFRYIGFRYIIFRYICFRYIRFRYINFRYIKIPAPYSRNMGSSTATTSQCATLRGRPAWRYRRKISKICRIWAGPKLEAVCSGMSRTWREIRHKLTARSMTRNWSSFGASTSGTRWVGIFNHILYGISIAIPSSDYSLGGI